MHFPTSLWNPVTLIATQPPLTWPWQWYFVGLLVLLFIVFGLSFLPILPRLLAHPFRKVAFNNVLIGIFLFFFRYERVPILGMDLWRLVQECAIVVSTVLIVVHFRKTHPRLVLQAKVEQYRNRFLPKAKIRQ